MHGLRSRYPCFGPAEVADVGPPQGAGTAPGHFVLVDGLSLPLSELIEPAEAVTDAADSCPMEAITVRDPDDDRLIAPEP